MSRIPASSEPARLETVIEDEQPAIATDAGESGHWVPWIVPGAIRGKANEVAVLLLRLPEPVLGPITEADFEVMGIEVAAPLRPGDPHVDVCESSRAGCCSHGPTLTGSPYQAAGQCGHSDCEPA